MLPYILAIETPRERLLFADIYAAYAGRMLALARQRLREPSDAEDAVQQAFLSLAEHFSRLSRLPRPQLEAYLVVVTERKCINLLRRRARLDGAPFDEEAALVWVDEDSNCMYLLTGGLSRQALLDTAESMYESERSEQA